MSSKLVFIAVICFVAVCANSHVSAQSMVEGGSGPIVGFYCKPGQTCVNGSCQQRQFCETLLSLCPLGQFCRSDGECVRASYSYMCVPHGAAPSAAFRIRHNTVADTAAAAAAAVDTTATVADVAAATPVAPSASCTGNDCERPSVDIAN